MRKKLIYILCIGICLIIVGLCFFDFNENHEEKAKYVFLFIGDGMSTAQVELTEIYENSILGNEHADQKLLSFNNFPVVGMRKTYSYTNYITDSAASSTVLASGTLTYNGAINVDMDGNELIPITYDLKNNKKKIGIITTNSINHATPAGFFGSAKDRKEYDDLAVDLLNTDFDYFAGGTFALNDLKMDYIYDLAKKNNFTIIDDEEELKKIDKNNKNIVISPYATEDDYVPFALDHQSDFNFANYVKTAIDVLDNKNGFFIMAESGLIDTAGHHNDARSVIEEVKELDKGVKVALEFAKKHPNETLIIVTGDHETGGLSLGIKGYTLKAENLQSQKYSYHKLMELSDDIKKHKIHYEDTKKFISENYGISGVSFYNAYQAAKNGDREALYKKVVKEKQKQAYIAYTTTSHSADRIPVYAYGVGSETFSGVFKIEEFNPKLRSIILK